MINAQNPGGWLDPQRPGVPLNPERDGWHWVRWADYESGMEFTAFWSSGEWSDDWAHLAGDRQARRYIYLGPCHTPAEVAALVAAARRDGAAEEREACGRLLDAAERAQSVQVANSRGARREEREAAMRRTARLSAEIRARGGA